MIPVIFPFSINNIFNAKLFNGTLTNRTGLCHCFFTTFGKTSYFNSVCQMKHIQRTTFQQCSNFSMTKLLFWQTNFLRMISLQRMCFFIRVFTNRNNVTTFVVNRCCNILAGSHFSHV